MCTSQPPAQSANKAVEAALAALAQAKAGIVLAEEALKALLEPPAEPEAEHPAEEQPAEPEVEPPAEEQPAEPEK